jgi:hypothetical protein
LDQPNKAGPDIVFTETKDPMNDSKRSAISSPFGAGDGERLPNQWREFIRFCRELKHGEIERLSIQDGLPVLAEVIKKKIKF